MKPHTFFTNPYYVSIMAQKKKNKDSFEQKRLDELSRDLNQQFSETFSRIQTDYGTVGYEMAKSVNTALEDKDFSDFISKFYLNATNLLDGPMQPDRNRAYFLTLSTSIFFDKMMLGVPVNVPYHIEDVLAGDRYLRRFMREFCFDIYNSKVAEKESQTN